jgi:hypothetical protein
MLKPSLLAVAVLIGATAAAGKNPADRNLALNPGDVHEAGHGYPHASSNSEAHGEACFWAINAIDGRTDNRGHGAAFPSWGPEKRTDLWWRVDFDHAVEVRRVVLFVRADFPHDGCWRAGTLVFSDGSRIRIDIRKTAERQVYEFSPRETAFVMLTDLVQDEPPQWCALTEVEVWGREKAESASRRP